MDFLKRLSGCCRLPKHWLSFSKKSAKEKSKSFSKYEYYTYKFQSIVIWEHPAQTISCLLLIQLLFWMVVNLCWKFYGVIFTLLLIFCTHDVWTEKIWPEIRLPQADVVPYQEKLTSNPSILTTSQIEEYFNNVLLHVKMTFIRLKNLRSSQPTLFCSILSCCFGLLTVIGCTISGIWLLYLIVMTIFLSPGAYIHLLSPSMKTSLKQYLKDFAAVLSAECSVADADDEYVPKLSEEKLDEAYASVLQLNDDSNDFLSLDRDVLPSMDVVPSFDDSSLDDVDKFIDLKANLEFSESSSISSDVSDNIRFQGTHFNNADDDFDTSEDDNDKAFLPDLQHRRKASASDASTLSTFVSNLTFPDINQLGRNLLTNIMPSSSSSSATQSQKAPKQYNTDEEFEFVNESDVN